MKKVQSATTWTECDDPWQCWLYAVHFCKYVLIVNRYLVSLYRVKYSMFMNKSMCLHIKLSKTNTVRSSQQVKTTRLHNLSD